ncbi:MAG: hypothetical protein JWN04_1828 [Myxococcaceae bacterium]|nr:hypothetical protein [Myxococcaceae bacterium]
MRFPFPYFHILALALCALLASVGVAAAQQTLDDDRARSHFFAGESHFQAERWADAEREFSLAYELSRRPEMLINLSRAQERNGQLPEAIAALELLIAKHPNNPYRAEAETRIAAMRKQLSERVPEPSSAAEPPAPEPEAAPSPLVDPVAEPPPALPPVTLEPEAPQPARRAGAVWPPSLLTMSVGGAALVTAVVSLGTGLRAHHIYNDLDGRCPGGRCDAPFRSDRDHGQALARTSTAFTFVSVALAGSAAVLWVYDVKKKRDQPSTTGSVAVGIDGAGARLRARF